SRFGELPLPYGCGSERCSAMVSGRMILDSRRYPDRVRWILAIFVSSAFAQTPDLPRSVKQGGTLRIKGPGAAAKARMGERTVRLFPQPGGGTLGLMPMTYDQKPGDYTFELLDSAGAIVESAPVHVADARFRKQNVTIAPSLAELKPSPGETETVAEFRNT